MSTIRPNKKVSRILEEDLGSIHVRILFGMGNSERYYNDLSLFHLKCLGMTASLNAGAIINSLCDKGLIIKQGKVYQLTTKGKKLLNLLKRQIAIFDWTDRKVLDGGIKKT